jgi:hypothetical protein
MEDLTMKKNIITIIEVIQRAVKAAWIEIVATGKATAKTIVKTLNGILYEVTAKTDTNGNIAIHNLAIQGLLFNI